MTDRWTPPIMKVERTPDNIREGAKRDALSLDIEYVDPAHAELATSASDFPTVNREWRANVVEDGHYVIAAPL